MREANYPVEQHDHFSERCFSIRSKQCTVRKECFEEGNGLTFNKAIDLAKAGEFAEKATAAHE